MPLPESFRVGYVVKRYPRFSETFIVNEILAHESAGLNLDIFALRPPADTHFQPAIARVRASVTYLQNKGKMDDLWASLQRASDLIPATLTDILPFRDEPASIILQAVQLATAVRERGISHLHAHFATSATVVARIAAHLAGITYSFTAHAKDIFHESVSEQTLRALLFDASTTITVSDFNVDFLKKNYGAAAGRVTRIYNGLELGLFPYAAPQDRPMRIVAVGRLVEKKGFEHLVDACALLNEKGVRFECLIAGTGDREAMLRERIERNRLTDCVHLIGPQPQSELATLLQSAAVFAAPCVVGKDGNRDGLPTVLLESMALGTPCVSTAVTGIPEVIHHRKTGLIVPQENASSLADAMLELMQDSRLRVQLAEEARALIEARFDIHRNAELVRACFGSSSPQGDTLPASSIHIAQSPREYKL